MRRIAAVAAMTAMLGAVGLVASPASAQVGYPPGPCVDVSSSQSIGSFAVGTTFSFNITPTCAFTAGTSVAVSVNGVNTGVKTAGPGGIPISITILSPTQLSVDDPVLVPAVCGINSIVATGASAAAGGQVVTHTVLFEVVCPPAVVVAQPPTRVAFTGANILRWGAIALGMIGIGALFVSSSRKRRQRTPELVG
jgi:hypothetical protein